jgi:nitrite reductase/ring-hydroxylating ferredoxin subunit/uncharacterized membrane protein
MAIEPVRAVTGPLTGWIDQESEMLDGLAKGVQSPLAAWVRSTGALGESIKNFLHGVWLGHSLHPALTDVPIGAWTAGVFFDLFGPHEAADAAYALGSLAAVPTALSGTADWLEITDKQRRVGFVHAILNVLGLGLILLSLNERLKGRRKSGVVLSMVGYGVASISAWLGGELVYLLGTAVSRNAFEPIATDFVAAADFSSLVEGQLTAGRIEVDGQTVPLVLLKRGSDVYALNGVCSHSGGPLPDGKLLDNDCVECPWHRSQFSMHDGSVRRGPATVAQPSYDVRIRDGKVEVRQRP